jgi:diguanylate cyclase (GGDEF)-like protein
MQQTANAEGLAVAVIDALTSHICVLDHNGTIIAVNRAWQEYGRAANTNKPSDIGVNYLDVCHGVVGDEANEAQTFSEAVRSVLLGELEYFQLEYPCPSPTEAHWYLARVSPLYHDHVSIKGKPSGAVVSHANITERKSLETKLAHMAATDWLTGLLNRRAFVEQTAAAIASLCNGDDSASLLMFDVDGFKTINDTYGHQAGDQALKAVATASTSALRANDLLARIGGEEFACFMPRTGARAASRAAERLRRAVAALKVIVPPSSFKLTVSIGISCMPPNGKKTLDDMLVSADRAMYLAKSEGKNCVRLDSPTDFRVYQEPNPRA